MNCCKCGKEVAQDASFCPACGNPLSPGVVPPVQPTQNVPVKINTWLVPAILATVFCCLPFGIVSIVFASRANSAMGIGNYQLAQENANKAKTWFWWAFGCGIVSSVLWIILQVAAAAVSAAN